MGIRSFLSKPLAKYTRAKIDKWATNAVATQQNVFESLISVGKATLYGQDHNFKDIRSHKDFVKNVPINDYEDLKGYIQQVIDGKPDVLWKNKPIYFAKTSGTTSGTKYIPLTKESIPYHIGGARDAFLCYIEETKKSEFLDGNMMFLSGSPELDLKGHIPTGRLSGIVNHHVPGYLRSNQVPSFKTNCIEDWETKLDQVVAETIKANMTLIGGIPPWVQMYLDRLEQKSGKKAAELFPNLSIYVYGGVNFEPYKAKIYESFGKKLDGIETYPASEGFIAYQDRRNEQGLLLLLNSGVFYEFIPVSEYFSPNPTRLTIQEVEIGVNYALIMTTNAGLWAYSIGDTIKFVSKDPYRIVVTGRIKHFLSAFGEHVIGEEIDKAMRDACAKHPGAVVTEFTVAPQVTPAEGLPYHEWFVEFDNPPADVKGFVKDLDAALVKYNVYYDDLISGNILRPLVLNIMYKNTFIDYMKSIGKLGGQNKLPRLSNDRKIADALTAFISQTIK
ncbi:MAG TPA: GH3 auxin-responsive promoter family protein [Cytophagales bacterium]|nr:GH3 auxin-responsive promoter family protein [Cytophagales bacterium]